MNRQAACLLSFVEEGFRTHLLCSELHVAELVKRDLNLRVHFTLVSLCSSMVVAHCCEHFALQYGLAVAQRTLRFSMLLCGTLVCPPCRLRRVVNAWLTFSTQKLLHDNLVERWEDTVMKANARVVFFPRESRSFTLQCVLSSVAWCSKIICDHSLP